MTRTGTMDKTGANAYVYAKVCGMHARSFRGNRLPLLFDADSLEVLWARVTTKEKPLVPEMLLARSLETEATERFVREYVGLLGAYEKPPLVAARLLQVYDYTNLKMAVSALCNRKTEPPPFTRIAPYHLIDYDAWPRLDGMTAGGPAAWYRTVPDIHTQAENDETLDRQYARSLWESLEELPRKAQEMPRALIEKQFAYGNIVWAIRLRTYFALSGDEVVSRLVFPQDREARAILSWPTDDWAAWSTWKYREVLNPPVEGQKWVLDPRWVEHRFNALLQKAALAQLHLHPEEAGVLVAWFIIKRYEVGCIRTAVERLRLGADAASVTDFI
jgi:vacuolar-type H+-ATPase subunit C/Vma6